MDSSNRRKQKEDAEAPASKKSKTDDGTDAEKRQKQKAAREFPDVDASSEAGIIERLKERVAELEKKNKELDKKNKEEKKELEKKNKELQNFSLRRLIRRPPTMNLKAVGSDRSHTGKSKHKNAEVEMNPDVKLQEVNDSEQLNRPSRLLMKFGADDPTVNRSLPLEITYATESDVSQIVSSALEDAKILVEHETKRKFYVHHEFSLFSARPDHLVLFDEETNDPILAVEDKKPWDISSSSSSSSAGPDEIPGPVLGQVFDYIMELRAFGHFAPFVVLSTFSQSWLFWQGNDVASNKLVTSDNKLTSVLQALPDTTSPTRLREEKKKTPSPPDLTDDEMNANISASTFRSVVRKGMHKSKAYGSDELVPLFYTALLCSLERNPAARCKTISKLSGGHNGLALKLNKDSYEWGNLQIQVGKSVQLQSKIRGTRSRPAAYQHDSEETTYFVAKKIARGATSKVFGAYDQNGKPCVIKMYVKRAEDDRGKLLSIAESRKQGEKLCRLEVKRLATFYNALKEKVFYKELHNFPCVVMPLFEPLTKDERMELKEQETKERKLKTCLSKFKDECGQYWKYVSGDIRWRHVGYYVQEGKEKEMVMFDLAELEEINKDDVETNVQSQVNELVDRLPDP